jgi:hypothetical protein
VVFGEDTGGVLFSDAVEGFERPLRWVSRRRREGEGRMGDEQTFIRRFSGKLKPLMNTCRG